MFSHVGELHDASHFKFEGKSLSVGEVLTDLQELSRLSEANEDMKENLVLQHRLIEALKQQVKVQYDLMTLLTERLEEGYGGFTPNAD